MNSEQALVRNMRTCRPDDKGEATVRAKERRNDSSSYWRSALPNADCKCIQKRPKQCTAKFHRGGEPEIGETHSQGNKELALEILVSERADGYS